MLTTALTLITSGMIGQFFFGQPMAIDTDHLKAPAGEKRVMLIMDVSGSMRWGTRTEPCNGYFNPTYNGGSDQLNKNLQMKAAAIGCNFPGDGFLDAWADQIDFAITAFGYSTAPYVRYVQPFTRDLTALQNTVLSLPADGSTPMQWGILAGSREHDRFWRNSTPNTYECDQHFNVLMTDGVPNDCGDTGNCSYDAYCDTPNYNWAPCDSPANFTPFVPPPGTSGYYDGSGLCGAPGTPRYAAPYFHYNYCVDPGQCDVVGAAGYVHSDAELPDAVCRLDGNQNITTYAIGFGLPGDLDENLLRSVAARGGGRYYFASSAGQLTSAFNEILNAIINRTGRFTPPSIQTDGLYVGNDSYSAFFKAEPGRPWIGNVKAYCVNPRLINGTYESSAVNSNCLFVHTAPPVGYTGSPQTYLSTNPNPLDRFSSNRSLEADVGGAAWKILFDYFNNQAPLYDARITPSDPPRPDVFQTEFGGTNPLDFYNGSGGTPHRNLLTWTSPTSGYVPVYSLSDNQLIASACHKTRLLSYLYGYDPNTVDCLNQRPTAVGVWPLGASVNAHPTILRWSSNCTSGPNQCLVAVNMDDGGIHFFDTYDGSERTVIIPQQLFVPAQAANYPLSSILDQPTIELSRRPYLDGPLFRFHDDRNANGIIDAGEAAFLVAGLGHGGAGYYFMDVQRQFTATPDNNFNAMYSLVPTPGNWTENMRDSLARPYIGRVQFRSNQSPVITAVIPSGHVWYQDRPDEEFNRQPIGLKPRFDPNDGTSPVTIPCATFATYNGLDQGNFDVCTDGATPGYDYPFTGCNGAPGDYRTPAVWYENGVFPYALPAGAMGSITFSIFDLDDGGRPTDPADYVVLEDVDGHEISPRLSGRRANPALGLPPFTWNGWVTSRPFFIHIHVDGNCDLFHTGILIDSIKYLPDRLFGGCGGGDPCEPCDTNDNGQCTGGECNAGAPQDVLKACRRCDTDHNGNCSGSTECGKPDDPAQCGVHNPFIAFVDMTLINGPSAVQGRPAAQKFQDRTLDGSAKLLFTKVCPATFTGGRCYDQGTPRGAGAVFGTGDLQYMYCPIIAEVRGYEEGGIAKAFYEGDQCGQMWKIWTDNNGDDWNAKVLFRVNDLSTTANYESRAFRRFDRPVDLVISQCKGNRSVGVYFGTGNTARPAALDNLELPSAEANITTAVAASSLIRDVIRVRNHNVVGAFFDSGQWNTTLPSPTLSSFQDVTPATPVEPPVRFNTGNDGWFWALLDDEQMLRDPLVFQGIAYFKTNQGLAQVTTCRPGVTTDRVYAVDNCTSLPADATHPNSGTAGRQQWSGQQDVGGNVLLYTPKDGPPIVSVGDTSNPSSANLVTPKLNQRTLQMYLWWRAL